MSQYRKTLADIWLEKPPARRKSDPVNGAVLEMLLSGMPEAVVLSAQGVEEMLSETKIGSLLKVSNDLQGEAERIDVEGWDLTAFPQCVPGFSKMLVEVSGERGGRRGVYFSGGPTEVVAISLLRNEQDRGWETGRSLVYDPDLSRNEGEIVPLTTWPAPRLPDNTLASGLLALSLTHCRNVEMVECHPPKALSARHEERHGRPLCRYYTLDIKPMRKVLETEGRMGEVGLKKALHVCRGHFKDYRESGGLFGKHKGLYWWDSNVRGTIERGIVAKDYAIKIPESK